jgi:hypothetical protein
MADLSERTKVRTVADLATLDEAEMLEGYLDGFAREREPGDNRSRSYWHGWRNGHTDRFGGGDEAQTALAHEVIKTGYLGSFRP